MVAKVYGRFKPDAEERDRWERIAAARDAEKWAGRVAKDVVIGAAESEKLHEQTPQVQRLARVTMIAGAGLEPATPAL